MIVHTSNEGSILVVDDETSLRETFHFFLTREGYAPVLTASGYEQALAMIRSEKIDLIIAAAHEEGRLEHWMFGRTVDELTRKMPCSILLVKYNPWHKV